MVITLLQKIVHVPHAIHLVEAAMMAQTVVTHVPLDIMMLALRSAINAIEIVRHARYHLVIVHHAEKDSS